jgi:hypothetical protein
MTALPRSRLCQREVQSESRRDLALFFLRCLHDGLLLSCGGTQVGPHALPLTMGDTIPLHGSNLPDSVNWVPIARSESILTCS